MKMHRAQEIPAPRKQTDMNKFPTVRTASETNEIGEPTAAPEPENKSQSRWRRARIGCYSLLAAVTLGTLAGTAASAAQDGEADGLWVWIVVPAVFLGHGAAVGSLVYWGDYPVVGPGGAVFDPKAGNRELVSGVGHGFMLVAFVLFLFHAVSPGAGVAVAMSVCLLLAVALLLVGVVIERRPAPYRSKGGVRPAWLGVVLLLVAPLLVLFIIGWYITARRTAGNSLAEVVEDSEKTVEVEIKKEDPQVVEDSEKTVEVEIKEEDPQVVEDSEKNC